MGLSIEHTVLPGITLAERFERAASYGLAAAEIVSGMMPSPLPDQVHAIERATAASGWCVSSVCTSGSDAFVHPYPTERRQRLAGLGGSIQAAWPAATGNSPAAATRTACPQSGSCAGPATKAGWRGTWCIGRPLHHGAGNPLYLCEGGR